MSQEFLDAATAGDVARVKAMLHQDPLLARVKDQNGVSVIMKATYYGKRDVVAALLDSGVELDIFDAQAQTLEKPHSGAVEKRRDQSGSWRCHDQIA